MSKQQNNRRERDIGGLMIRAVEGAGNERKLVLSFSSEEPYQRYWGKEILDHSEGAINLTRLTDIGVVLFNHKRDVVIGKINRVWVENNRGNAEIEFDTDEESEKIYQKVKTGTLKGVSVGYSIDALEEIKVGATSADGRFTGPAEVARKWTPYEISIVSVPADSTVGVGRDMYDSSNTGRSLLFYEWQLKIDSNSL